MIGSVPPKHYRKAHYNPMFGRNHSEETKEKMRKARLGKKFPRKPKELTVVSAEAIAILSKLAAEEINKTRNDSNKPETINDVVRKWQEVLDDPVTFDEFGKPL